MKLFKNIFLGLICPHKSYYLQSLGISIFCFGLLFASSFALANEGRIPERSCQYIFSSGITMTVSPTFRGGGQNIQAFETPDTGDSIRR